MANKSLQDFAPSHWPHWYCSNMCSLLGDSALQKQSSFLGNLILTLPSAWDAVSQKTYGKRTPSLFQVSPQMLPTQKSLPQPKIEDILSLTSHPTLFFFPLFDTIKNSITFFLFGCWFNACPPSAPSLPLERKSYACLNLCSLL